jgi:hypothetical protein
MENILTGTEVLAGTIREYVNNRLETEKLGAAEKTAGLLAQLCSIAIIGMLLLLSFLTIGVALSILLGAWIGKPWLGFLIVGAIYSLLGIFAWLIRVPVLKLPLVNYFIKQIFSKANA